MFKRRRRYRPRKGPLPFRYVLLISFVIFVILTVQGLNLVEKGIRPTLLSIAQTETQRIGTLAINQAVYKKTLENTNMENLIEKHEDNNGNLTSVNFNPVIANRVLHETTHNVQKYLNDIALGRVKDLSIPESIDVEQNGDQYFQDGIIHWIPLGQATQNALLAHLGPKVPVRLTAIGDVKSQLSRNIEATGINNTTIEYMIDISVDVKIVIPFATSTEVVETSILVGSIFIPGVVPEFFSSGDGGLPMPAIIRQGDLDDAVNRSNENN